MLHRVDYIITSSMIALIFEHLLESIHDYRAPSYAQGSKAVLETQPR